MQLYEGWTLIELTEDRIVQEKQFGTGKVRMVGNPNPPPEEHEELMQRVGEILYKGYLRRIRKEKEDAEKNRV